MLPMTLSKTRSPHHDLLPWIIEHAMSIYRRTHVGSDGRTCIERIRGRSGRDVVAEFGESILYLPLRGNLDDKRASKINLEPRFLNGIFLGLSDASDELIVWNASGRIKKGRTIRRRPEMEMFNKEELLAVRGTPLQPNPDSSDVKI